MGALPPAGMDVKGSLRIVAALQLRGSIDEEQRDPGRASEAFPLTRNLVAVRPNPAADGP